ncbi:HNH/ENDO VII family nuclease [Cytobacillus sp. Hz8]|uniref:HNH/ENDO VII family nuclease n=1 Tax=Cytobacillus sp. Hz8 TaxID=3347168 RepID=UPI0035E3AC9C
MDVKYIPSDWEKMRKGISDHILGIGFGKGMIDHLKDLNEILEDAEADIAKYDSDGVISFQHTSQKGKYEELEKDFDILHSFSGIVGEIVDRTIDEPFYQDMDAFVEAIRNIDPMKYKTKNRIGATEIKTIYEGYGTTRTIEVPKTKVSLEDLFSGDNFYGEKMKLEYEEWKQINPDQDFSQKEYQRAVLNSRAFEYESIRDTQESKEILRDIVTLGLVIVAAGVTFVAPPAGITLGLAVGTISGVLELKSAVTGKDWVSGRELGTGERLVRGALAPLDIVPGVSGVTKFTRITGIVKYSEKLAKMTTKVTAPIKQDVNQVRNLVETARKMGTARLKNAGEVIKNAGAKMKNKVIDDIIETGKIPDYLATQAKKLNAVLNPGLVTNTGHRVKETVENDRTVEKKLDAALSKYKVDIGSSTKGTGKDYKNYKAVEYTGTTKINGEERDISRRVFQRIDIDYKRIDPDTGMTNFQLMKKGRAPIWKDGTVIELHHLIQREPGSMVEIPASMHDEYNKILHGLVENGGSFRNDPVLKKQYDNFRSKYWRWRAKQIDKSEL